MPLRIASRLPRYGFVFGGSAVGGCWPRTATTRPITRATGSHRRRFGVRRSAFGALVLVLVLRSGFFVLVLENRERRTRTPNAEHRTRSPVDMRGIVAPGGPGRTDFGRYACSVSKSRAQWHPRSYAHESRLRGYSSRSASTGLIRRLCRAAKA